MTRHTRPIGLAIAAAASALLVAGALIAPAQQPGLRVHVDRLPAMPAPRPVGALPIGTVFRAGPGGSLWMIADPVDYRPADPSHVLYGVRAQPANPSWYREQIQLGGDNLCRWHVGLVVSPAAIATLELPRPVWAVSLEWAPGTIVRMDAETWAVPVAGARLTVREVGDVGEVD
jgi:hypothetical protein